MYIIQKNQVLALLALTSSTVVEAKKRKIAEERPKNRGIPKKPALQSINGPGVTPNVINGQDAPPNEYPWYSRGIDSSGDWWGCGGTLITPEFVMTAAHCGYDATSGWQIGALCDPYEVNDNCGGTMETIMSKKVFEHPGWDDWDIVNDFTLVQLDERSTMEFAPPDQGDVSTSYEGGESLWVIGLGADQHYGFGVKTYPDHVQHAEVPYVDSDTCTDIMKGYLGNSYELSDTELCAGPTDLSDPAVGTCNGDSGGPIFDKASNTLVGVTSWGIQGFGGLLAPYCGDTPGVYARIADQWDNWIKPTICDNHSDPKPCYCDDSCSDDDDTPPVVDDDDDDDAVVVDDDDDDNDTEYCGSGEALLEFKLTTDGYGEDTSWAVSKKSGNSYSLYEGPFGHLDGNDYGDNQDFEESLCLPKNQCYKHVVLDAFGDGLCCKWGDGSYEVIWDGDSIIDTKFNNGDKSLSPDFGNC